MLRKLALFTVLSCSLFVNTPELVNARPESMVKGERLTPRVCLLTKAERATLKLLKVDEDVYGHHLELFDRNGDGEGDYAEVTEHVRGQLRPFPFRFELDPYLDGKDVEVWIDMMGNGRCQDLRQLDPKQPEREM